MSIFKTSTEASAPQASDLSPEIKPEANPDAKVQAASPQAIPAAGHPAAQPLPSGNFAPPSSRAPRRLGDVLIEMGMIKPVQLEQALSEGRATGAPLGTVLLKLGFVDETHLGKALARLHGLQYIDTHDLELKPEVMNLIPNDFVRQHLVVPLSLDPINKRMEVIMARPDNLHALDEIALLTGYRPIPRVSTHKEILNLLDRFYLQRATTDEAIKKIEENFSKDDSVYSEGITSELEAEMAADDAPVVQLVNSLLIEAIESDASDLHIEPQKERLLVRFRIHGILHETKSIPKKMAAAVTSRIKVASGMDIAERRRPQDGRMKIKHGSQEVDMRVNTLAIQFGEKIVIRLLKPTATTGGLEKLGLPEDEAKRIHKMIHAPNGVVLVTGPTGSGKTTTLYACLRELNSPERNITTIEDPVEYPLSGVNQTQVSHKSGLTFALCLRAILRQDPDIVMVGEIRDEETLESAIHAALTGHLVFSTLHTNSTAKTVTRLLEMGAKPYLVSSAIVGIIAQRLVRRVCSRCKMSYEATPEELQILGLESPVPITLYKGAGCDRCNQTGYEGRIGLYEIMNFDRDIQELIDNGGSAYALQDAAVKNGMFTLAMDGKRKVLSGMTTVDEVTRVLGLDLAS
ncbi:MAG: ATPase, T2SS/T4P/T4SS family [Vampirovibrionales bacterium]|nr:ATPase, T2SS/T4P/T4SS family [Vampirovibrionales bacterium]